MNFKPLELKIFKKKALRSCTCPELEDRIKGLSTNVPDPIVFLFNDNSDILLKELYYFNKRKTFFKTIIKERLKLTDIKGFSAMLTHLGIGMINRVEHRNDVDLSYFTYLRSKVNGIIDSLLEGKEVDNPFYRELNLIHSEEAEVS